MSEQSEQVEQSVPLEKADPSEKVELSEQVEQNVPLEKVDQSKKVDKSKQDGESERQEQIFEDIKYSALFGRIALEGSKDLKQRRKDGRPVKDHNDVTSMTTEEQNRLQKQTKERYPRDTRNPWKEAGEGMGELLFDILMSFLAIVYFIWIKTVYVYKYVKRCVFRSLYHNHQGSIVFLFVVFLVCVYFSMWAVVLLAKRTSREIREAVDITNTCLEMDNTNRYFCIEVSHFVVDNRTWPCGQTIPLTRVELMWTVAFTPFCGSIYALIDNNEQFIKDHDVACAGPAIYGVPLNVVTLARDGTVIYNGRISGRYGEKQLITEQSVTGLEKRSRLLYPMIEVESSSGKLNITDAETAFCLQSYLK